MPLDPMLVDRFVSAASGQNVSYAVPGGPAGSAPVVRIGVVKSLDSVNSVALCTVAGGTTQVPVAVLNGEWPGAGNNVAILAVGQSYFLLGTLGVSSSSDAPGLIKAYAGIAAPFGYLICDGGAYVRSSQTNLFAAVSLTSTATTHGTTSVTAIPTGIWNQLQTGWYCSGTNITGGTTTFTLGSSGTVTLSGAATGSTVGGAIVFSPYPLGNGTTTANVPDGRGKSLLGAGTGAGLTARVLGAVGGEEANAHTHGEAAHTHPLSSNGWAQYTSSGSGAAVWMNRITIPSYTPNIATTPTSVAGTVAAQTLGVALAGATDSTTPGATGSPSDTSNMDPFLVANFIIKT